MSKEEFEQNVKENEAEKEAFKQANKDLKNGTANRNDQNAQPPANTADNNYNATKIKHQIEETPAYNESEYWSEEQEKYRLDCIKRDTGLGEEESKEILYALSGDRKDYTSIWDTPQGWFYGADTKIRNMEGEYKGYAEIIDKYVVSAPKYEGAIYRGLALDDSVLSTLQVGMNFDEKGALSSWTSEMDVAKMFGQERGKQLGATPVIIKTENHKYASPVSHLSVFGMEESEVLVSNLHDIQYTVANITTEKGVKVITLKWE